MFVKNEAQREGHKFCIALYFSRKKEERKLPGGMTPTMMNQTLPMIWPSLHLVNHSTPSVVFFLNPSLKKAGRLLLGVLKA